MKIKSLLLTAAPGSVPMKKIPFLSPSSSLSSRSRTVPPRLVPGAFTLMELLVVIAIIAVLAVLAFLAFRGVLEKGRQASCLGNLRGLGAALFTYAADNGGELPSSKKAGLGYSEGSCNNFCRSAGGYPTMLKDYTGGWKAFFCPSDSQSGLNKANPPPTTAVSYMMRHCLDMWSHRGPHYWGKRSGLFLNDLAFPSRQIIMHEVRDWHGGLKYGKMTTPATYTMNAVFGDGSVRVHKFGPEYVNGDYHWFPYGELGTPISWARGFHPSAGYDLAKSATNP